MTDLHNTEAEQQLLGALLLDAANLDAVGELAKPGLFDDPAHRDLFNAIAERHARGDLVSPVALKMWADDHDGLRELGGAKYLVRLAGASIASRQCRHYAVMLDGLRAKRSIKAALDDAQKALGSDSAAEVAARLEAAMMAEVVTAGGGPVSMLKATTDALKTAHDAHMGLSTPGIYTGIGKLDHFLGKLAPGQFIILGGRPSMGKTAVALQMALNAARAGHGVAMATLEMTPEAMARRALSEETSRRGNAVPYSKMTTQETNAAQMQTLVQAAEAVKELPLHFLPTEYRSIGALAAGAKRAAVALGGAGLKLLIVDYLQLLRADGRTRLEQITKISIALKALAMQLEVPVLALSQLSRALESRDDKRPMMSDLRESGQLEQDADAILFCYRDEYYLERDKPDVDDGQDAWDAWDRAMENAKNRLEIIVAKQRQGPIGTAHVKFNPATNLIWE